MAGRFLGGMIAGAIVGLAGAAAVSLYSGRPASVTDPVAEPVPGPAPVTVPVPETETPATVQSDPVAEPATDPAPEPAPDAPATAQTDPAPRPQVGEAALLDADAPPAAPAPAPVTPDPPVAAAPDPVPPALPDSDDTGDVPPVLPDADVAAPDPQTVEEPALTDAPAAEAAPLRVFAAPFEAAGDAPLVGLILIDTGNVYGGQATADLPFPVTVALDPSLADASTRLARHRAAGHEVVLLSNLPETAGPDYARGALDAGLDLLRQSVAVAEGAGTGFRRNPAVTAEVARVAAATGRGLVLQPDAAGLPDDVPGAVLFQDIDLDDAAPAEIRAILDDAAAQAAGNGAAVVMGRIRPETISAVLLWNIAPRADGAVLAPVSAVLSRENG